VADFSRLSRRDALGLIWLLDGRSVIAMTDQQAEIRGAGGVLIYRKHGQPAVDTGESVYGMRADDDRARGGVLTPPSPEIAPARLPARFSPVSSRGARCMTDMPFGGTVTASGCGLGASSPPLSLTQTGMACGASACRTAAPAIWSI
jgi:hypothetical protein